MLTLKTCAAVFKEEILLSKIKLTKIGTTIICNKLTSIHSTACAAASAALRSFTGSVLTGKSNLQPRAAAVPAACPMAIAVACTLMEA